MDTEIKNSVTVQNPVSIASLPRHCEGASATAAILPSYGASPRRLLQSLGLLRNDRL